LPSAGVAALRVVAAFAAFGVLATFAAFFVFLLMVVLLSAFPRSPRPAPGRLAMRAGHSATSTGGESKLISAGFSSEIPAPPALMLRPKRAKGQWVRVARKEPET